MVLHTWPGRECAASAGSSSPFCEKNIDKIKGERLWRSRPGRREQGCSQHGRGSCGNSSQPHFPLVFSTEGKARQLVNPRAESAGFWLLCEDSAAPGLGGNCGIVPAPCVTPGSSWSPSARMGQQGRNATSSELRRAARRHPCTSQSADREEITQAWLKYSFSVAKMHLPTSIPALKWPLRFDLSPQLRGWTHEGWGQG